MAGLLRLDPDFAEFCGLSTAHEYTRSCIPTRARAVVVTGIRVATIGFGLDGRWLSGTR